MYVKLFQKMLDSSIWVEDHTTVRVWITLLLSMNKEGYAHFSSPQNLAIRANVTLHECEAAIGKLLNPDIHSANKDNEGRRIERVPGGYMILNATLYRDLKTLEMEREATRERVRKYRERKKCNGKTLPTVTDRDQNVTPASASVSFIKRKELTKETVCAALGKNSAYEGLDIEKEFGKMETWCRANHKIPSERRFVNWLNRAERPLVKTAPTRIPGDAPANPNEGDYWNQLSSDQQKELINGK